MGFEKKISDKWGSNMTTIVAFIVFKNQHYVFIGNTIEYSHFQKKTFIAILLLMLETSIGFLATPFNVN